MGSAASATGISSHGDSLLVLLDVLEELDSSLQLPAVDGLSGLSGVLEGNSEVGTAGAGRLRGLDLGRGVSNLEFRKKEADGQYVVTFFGLAVCAIILLHDLRLLFKDAQFCPCFDNSSNS